MTLITTNDFVLSEYSIAVILPAYNEEQTISDTIRAFHEALPEAHIYVVNNNSCDKTAILAADTLHELHCKGDVIEETRQGKGNAVRRAFIDIDADIYVLADADSTYPAHRARELIVPIVEKRADMVVGDRLSGGRYARENERTFHSFGNWMVQSLVNILFNSQLFDIMSGYRIMNRTFVKNYPILVEGFQIEVDMTLHALHKRFRIMEIPVEYRNRPQGSSSKLYTLADGAKVIFTIVQVLRYYRPLAFFGGLSIFCMILGFVFSIPVFKDWVTSRYIYHVPLAILASALEIVAVMMFGIGLILDSMVHQQKMEYERNLLQMQKPHTNSKNSL